MGKGRKRSRGSSFTRNGHDDKRGTLNNGYLDMSEAHAPVGVGTSRLAYRCRVADGCYRGYTEGSYLIFKVFKPEDLYSGVSGVDENDVGMQLEAKRLCERFNAQCAPTKFGRPCSIHLRDAALGRFQMDQALLDDHDEWFYGRGGQPFLLEREIRGAFSKFNSNSGWTCGCDPILDAFSHWSWVETNQSKLVCDLQGHRGDGSLPYLGEPYYYLLTDPAICSEHREYGENDLGKKGITAFFKHHVCNEWCEKLGIEHNRPYISPYEPVLPKMQSTSYDSLTDSSSAAGYVDPRLAVLQGLLGRGSLFT